jgi:hypothetical protein
MLLSLATKVARTLRRLHYGRGAGDSSADFRTAIKAVSQILEMTTDDYEEIIDIFYPRHSKHPRRFVTDGWVRDNVCSELGISPLVWDESLVGKPIVLALASESRGNKSSGVTVKQALHHMHQLSEVGVLATSKLMTEAEAELFWSRALGENPPYPIERFIQRCTHIGEGQAMSLPAVKKALDTMSPAEFLVRLLKYSEAEVEVPDEIQPGQPFRGPVYKAWTQTTAPAGVYAEVIRHPRRYLHITEFPSGTFNGILYNRDKRAVAKMNSLDLPIQQACVLEVEAQGTVVKCITDILSLGQDWSIHQRPMMERLNLLKGLGVQGQLRVGELLEEGSSITNLVHTLSENERLRLSFNSPFQIGEQGGWAVMDGTYHIHLLVLSIKKDAEYETHVRLGVLDGLDPYQVMEARLPTEIAQHVRTRLARQGVLVGAHWLPVEEQAVVVAGKVNEVRLSTMTITGELLYADDNLGFSDLSQLTDIIEMT